MDLFGKKRQQEFEKKTFQALSTLSERMKLSRVVGDDNNRDLDDALNYPSEVTPQMLRNLWKRHAFARAVIEKPVTDTWKGGLSVKGIEGFGVLAKKTSLIPKLKRLDRLSQFGEYAILLLGFDDGQWGTQVSGGASLKYVRPVGRSNLDISKYETDKTDPRYGLPRIYDVEMEFENSTDTLSVHYSRVIHVAFDRLDNETEGHPKMTTAYNRLVDLQKVLGGSAEIYWRNARPGYYGKSADGYDLGEGAREAFKEQLDEYENNLRRFLLGEGIDLKSLEQPIADPHGHVRVQLEALAALYDIPIRILIGSEQGELASSQDKRRWNEIIDARRTDDIAPNILDPFITRMQQVGVLGEGEYDIEWADLFTISEKDKADVSKARADALAAYLNNPMGQEVVPLRAFLRNFMEFSEEETQQILDTKNTSVQDMLDQQSKMEDV